MNKSKLIKTLLVIILGMVLMFSTSVFAADDDYEDLLFGDDEDTATEVDTPSPIIADDNQPSSSQVPSTSGASADDNKLEVESTTKKDSTDKQSTSVYDTTTTPSTEKTPETISKAGIEDSVPAIALIAVAAVSAIYAYKKINDYKNI